MRCAILCNGPSRTAYTNPLEYSLVLGCNFPWTEVDATVIVDDSAVRKWVSEPDLITCPIYLSTRAFRPIKSGTRNKKFREQCLKPRWEVAPADHHSSGHLAAEIAISKGYKILDIYGCDSYFEMNNFSPTYKFVYGKPKSGTSERQVNGWRKRWANMSAKHPDVTFNFIRGNDDNA